MDGQIVVDDHSPYQPAPVNLTTAVVTGPPQQLTVSDAAGVLATLTVGSKTVLMRGQSRTFTEQKRTFTDDFTRTTTNGLGLSPGGGVWSNVTGTDARFSCDGSKALINLDVANTSRHATIKDDAVSDVDASAKVALAVAPAGASASTSLSFAYQDSNNQYRARLLVTTGGTIQLALEKEVSSTVTVLGALTTVGTGYTAGDWWWIRVKKTGTTLQARAWKDGTAEPGTWLHSVTDSAFTTGRVGFRAVASTGNTNVPFNVYADQLIVNSCTWAAPPSVTHNTWVRVLSQPFSGTWTGALADQVRAWATDTRPDALAYAMMFMTGALAVTDPALSGKQVYGQALYGPTATDGTRVEFSDWNDYIGMNWTYPNGEARTYPHGSITITNCLDCSGFVRMVYGRGLGIPMSFDLNFDGLNLPRRSADIGPSGPGVIVAQGVSSAPALTKLQVGDVLVFDADVSEPVEGQTDHVGIYLGLDSGGHPRMISSRKTLSGPTMSDLGGSSALDGTGTYATRLRIIRRF